MLPASHRGMGTAVGSPDTCNTPTGTGVDVPTPYVNTGDHTQSVGFSPTVYVTMMNAISQAATVPTTTGDESGTSHPTIKGVLTHTSGNPIVYVNSVPAVAVSNTTSHNNGNCPAGTVVSPGAATVFYTLKEGAAPLVGEHRAVRGDEVNAWAARISGATLVSVELAASDLTIGVRVISESTASELLSALRAHPAARSLTLDLRGVPGGTLHGACRLASIFLPAGAEVVRVTDSDGDVEVLRATDCEKTAIPLSILVDEQTASAAEIVALALHVHDRARVLGGPSYGKASVQTFDVRDGVRAYSTIAALAGPRGAILDGHYR
ncbi:MAG: S41 family peptidase [Polyangiaceae bacterium]